MVALALQWHTKVEYVTQLPVLFAMGFMAIDQDRLERLSENDQAVVDEVLTRIYDEVDAASEEDTENAIDALLNVGLQNVEPREGEVRKDPQHDARDQCADGRKGHVFGRVARNDATAFARLSQSAAEPGKHRSRRLVNDGPPRSPGRLERWGRAAQNAALVILLAAMMLLAVGQIVMRLVFSSGFVWADELLRLIVLWIALIASIAASRGGRHLRIDLLSHFVPARLARLPRLVAEGFAAGVCGVLAWETLALRAALPRVRGHGACRYSRVDRARHPAVQRVALTTWRFLLEALRQARFLLRPPAGDTDTT
ncbi:MAG: TRAP transporter small permease subunit [Woeseiaceae bacterium]|nr:TRAP transporter small permease subunit [Woeseiaceae bacterium]